jgi:hypothetical protein
MARAVGPQNHNPDTHRTKRPDTALKDLKHALKEVSTYCSEVSDPRFRPSAFVKGGQYGRELRVTWQLPSTLPNPEKLLAAAVVQHVHVARIRTLIYRDFNSVGAYAQTIGSPPDRLRAIIRGDRLLRTEDIADALNHWGHAAIPDPDRFADELERAKTDTGLV